MSVPLFHPPLNHKVFAQLMRWMNSHLLKSTDISHRALLVTEIWFLTWALLLIRWVSLDMGALYSSTASTLVGEVWTMLAVFKYFL